jgi:hypothetical protein
MLLPAVRTDRGGASLRGFEHAGMSKAGPPTLTGLGR